MPFLGSVEVGGGRETPIAITLRVERLSPRNYSLASMLYKRNPLEDDPLI